MRRTAWLAGLLMVLAGCSDASGESPLATYTGGPAEGDTFWIRGELALHDGCLAVEIEEDEDTFTAMLRLPTDDDAEPDWRGRQLWFHQRAHELGDELVFRATAVEATDLDGDVPAACSDGDLGHAVMPVDGTKDLALDPGPQVLGSGDQPRAFVAELSNAGMDALSSGELAVVGDGCLGISAGDDEDVMRWPFGTTVGYDPVQVTLPNGKSFGLGDRFEVGGGMTSETPQDTGDSDIRDVCGDDVGVFLVSPFD